MAYTDIDKPSDYFNTKLYTGTGTAQSITGVGFSPEMSWFKQRNTARGHILEDIVRGAGNTLFPHDTSSETAGGFYLTSFDSDGFTLPSSNVGTNESGGTYASWNWLAGGTGVSNTDGSITSTVSANTTSGFSIVSYTGTGSNATVGHGLGVAPSMIIIKARSAPESWTVYHKNLTSASYNLTLNDTSAETNNPSHFNSTAPTSSVFSIGTSGRVNISSQTQIAYCFAEKKGFSKFGSYIGNGSTDGSYIHLGFKPAWLMVKRTDSTESWNMSDNKRNPFNVGDKYFLANTTDAEGDVDFIDYTSNGFKWRGNYTSVNASGGTYIYMAFAESPFVTSSGIPTTAR